MKTIVKEVINGRVVTVAVAAMSVATKAMAFAAPASGDFAYEVYDMAYTKVLQGPIGYVMAMGCAGFGLWTCIDAKRGGMAIGIPMMAMGAVIYNIDKLASAVGGIF